MLICVFVAGIWLNRFSHDMAQIANSVDLIRQLLQIKNEESRLFTNFNMGFHGNRGNVIQAKSTQTYNDRAVSL